MKNIAIIGAGLQAQRRIPAIVQDPECRVTHVIDLDIARAEKFARSLNAQTSRDWQKAVDDPGVDLVLVLTYPDSHAEISITAMEAGKDVLCEKPLARTEEEGRQMVATAEKTKRILKCGFNHRHHPAIQEVHRLFTSGIIGNPLFGRGRYGIAGRQGLEKEWRSDPKIVSGGQLMEQGIHLVDLFRWFFGEMKHVTGIMSTTHWPIAPLEDNGFVLMQNHDGVVASIHSSLTQWINLFEFELYGERGSLTARALGGSYGVETLTISTHDPSGPFSYKTIEFRGDDKSWVNEWKEFLYAVESRKEPLGNGLDGFKAMEIVNAAYTASRSGQRVDIASAHGSI